MKINLKLQLVLSLMKLKKPHFNDFREDIPGPYYDPNDGHIHNWKNVSLIQNFSGEQHPRFSEYSIDTTTIVKNGEYCCICHIRKSGFVSIPINTRNTQNNVINYIKPYINTHEDEIKMVEIIPKKLYNYPLVLYKLNNHESLYIKYNEMTYYQKFRYKNPNYKNETLFIINNDKFTKNYYTLENMY